MSKNDYKTLGYMKSKDQIPFEDYFECDRCVKEIGSLKRYHKFLYKKE